MHTNATEILQRQEALLVEMAELTRLLRSTLTAPAGASTPPGAPPIPHELAGTRWNEQVARGAIGVLVRYARLGAPGQFTYSDLHQALVAEGAESNIGMMQKYAKPLDRICRALARIGKAKGLVVPLLTVLVVNGRTKQPSPGLNVHLVTWLKAEKQAELAADVEDVGSDQVAPRQALELAKRKVLEFKNWQDVLTWSGLTGDPATDMARPY